MSALRNSDGTVRERPGLQGLRYSRPDPDSLGKQNSDEPMSMSNGPTRLRDVQPPPVASKPSLTSLTSSGSSLDYSRVSVMCVFTNIASYKT